MRNLIRPALIAAMLAAATLGGIGDALAQPAPIPPPKEEGLRPPLPGPLHVWRPGHWEWENGSYRWVQGEWVLRESGWRRGVFVAGHWSRRGSEWVWISGHFE